MFTGEACDIPVCPNNCSYSNGVCKREQHKCDCNSKYKGSYFLYLSSTCSNPVYVYSHGICFTGDDCSQVADNGYWEVIQPKDFLPQGSASHTAVVWRDSMYVIGGESFNRAEMIYVYDFNGKLVK